MRLIVFVIIVFFSLSVKSQVVINEIMSSNSNTIIDEDGDNSDWIEIYNFSNDTINLSNFFLSDDDDERYKWEIPDIDISPKEFIIIYASGKDRRVAGNELHTNFKISKQGEPVILSDNNSIISRIPPFYVETDYSMGRYPDASNDFFLFANPSPDCENGGKMTVAKNIELNFSHNQGYYDYEFLLNILSNQNAEIRYSLDGTALDDSSEIYSKAIKITSRKGHKNVYSEIQTSEDRFWLPPKSEVPKVNIIRAQAFENSIPVSPEIIGTYWTGHHNPKVLNLPLLSIISCPSNLFDYHKGILVPGINFELHQEENSLQRGEEWEREANFTFFDTVGEAKVSQNVGIRVHGGWTRKYRQKSLRIYARNRYGNEYIKYPFFENRDYDEFKRLLVTSSMKDDYTETLIKDELVTSLARDFDLDYQEFIPVIVFLNGEYWGIQYIKERRDKYWLEATRNIDPNNVDWLAWHLHINQGQTYYYENLLSYLRGCDYIDPQTYKDVKQYIDIDNFINYMCFEIYLNNRDWPHNNIEYWRPDTIDGKWRWIIFDFDRSFEVPEDDNFSLYFEYENDFAMYSLLRLMFKIPEFKNDFMERMYYHMENTFSPEKIMSTINEFQDLLSPHIYEHINRWQFPETSYEWNKNLDLLQHFALNRPAEINHIINRKIESQLNIFPNPVGNIAYIHISNSELAKEDITLFDLSGKTLNVDGRINILGDKASLIMTDLDPAVYFIQVRNNGIIFTEKIIKI